MDVLPIIFGALLMIGPSQLRRSMRQAPERIRQRGGDADRFERAWDRPSITVLLVGLQIAGVAMIILGLTG